MLSAYRQLAAKREAQGIPALPLTAVRPDYFERLSPASIHTLDLQGGPMNEEEVKEFEKNVYLEQCINLRYWDEDAKDPERIHPAFSYYRPLVESLVKY